VALLIAGVNAIVVTRSVAMTGNPAAVAQDLRRRDGPVGTIRVSFMCSTDGEAVSAF